MDPNWFNSLTDSESRDLFGLFYRFRVGEVGWWCIWVHPSGSSSSFVNILCRPVHKDSVWRWSKVVSDPGYLIKDHSSSYRIFSFSWNLSYSLLTGVVSPLLVVCLRRKREPSMYVGLSLSGLFVVNLYRIAPDTLLDRVYHL